MDKIVKLMLFAVGVIGLLFIGNYAYNQKIKHDKRETNINHMIEKIDKEVKNFNAIKFESNGNNAINVVNQSKLKGLRQLQRDLKSYKQEKESYQPVIKKYNQEIKALQKYFKDLNKTALDKLGTTKALLDKNNDKAKLQQVVKQLEIINNTVKSEIKVVYSKKEAKSIQAKVTNIQKFYQDRIRAIEAKEKAEAEAKAIAETKTANDDTVVDNTQGQAVETGGNVVQNDNQTASNIGGPIGNYNGGNNAGFGYSGSLSDEPGVPEGSGNSSYSESADSSSVNTSDSTSESSSLEISNGEESSQNNYWYTWSDENP